MAGNTGGHHISDIIHPHHKGSDKAPGNGPKTDSEGRELDEHGRVKQGDGTWDPTGKDVAEDTIEDRNKEAPHGSYEDDMKKKKEHEKNDNKEIGEKTGGDKGDADQSFEKNPTTDKDA